MLLRIIHLQSQVLGILERGTEAVYRLLGPLRIHRRHVHRGGGRHLRPQTQQRETLLLRSGVTDLPRQQIAATHVSGSRLHVHAITGRRQHHSWSGAEESHRSDLTGRIQRGIIRPGIPPGTTAILLRDVFRQVDTGTTRHSVKVTLDAGVNEPVAGRKSPHRHRRLHRERPIDESPIRINLADTNPTARPQRQVGTQIRVHSIDLFPGRESGHRRSSTQSGHRGATGGLKNEPVDETVAAVPASRQDGARGLRDRSPDERRRRMRVQGGAHRTTRQGQLIEGRTSRSNDPGLHPIRSDQPGTRIGPQRRQRRTTHITGNNSLSGTGEYLRAGNHGTRTESSGPRVQSGVFAVVAAHHAASHSEHDILSGNDCARGVGVRIGQLASLHAMQQGDVTFRPNIHTDRPGVTILGRRIRTGLIPRGTGSTMPRVLIPHPPLGERLLSRLFRSIDLLTPKLGSLTLIRDLVSDSELERQTTQGDVRLGARRVVVGDHLPGGQPKDWPLRDVEGDHQPAAAESSICTACQPRETPVAVVVALLPV